MNIMQATRLQFETIKPKIGARVLNSKEELLSGELSPAINELLEQRGVLVFKQLHLTEEEQIQFSNSLGGNATEMGVDGGAIFSISLDKGEHHKSVIEYLKGSLFWHVDGTMNPVPVRGSILTSKVLPTWGGNTEFSNCYAAYADLSQEAKDKIDDLRVIHAIRIAIMPEQFRRFGALPPHETAIVKCTHRRVTN